MSSHLLALICALVFDVGLIRSAPFKALAFAAPTTAVLAYLRIFRRVLVTPLAMRLTGIRVLAVAHLVVLVGAAGVPSQVEQPVVLVVVVVVAALHALWARTYECLQDQLVDPQHLPPLAVGQVDIQNTVQIPSRLEDS